MNENDRFRLDTRLPGPSSERRAREGSVFSGLPNPLVRVPCPLRESIHASDDQKTNPDPLHSYVTPESCPNTSGPYYLEPSSSPKVHPPYRIVSVSPVYV